MITYLEMVSKVMNTLKLNNRDEHISRRFVLSLLKSTATQIISQKWLDRTIVNETNLYTQINCFDFERIDVKSCSNLEFRLCNILMKSVKPLPKLVFSRLGSSVKEVYSLDGSYKFVMLDKGQYTINKKRRYKIENEIYIYLDSDNHLYIPDREIYTVDLSVLTLDTENTPSCDKDLCKSNWEYEFKCPDKLIDVVFNQTLQILGLNKQIREDQNPNGIQGT